MTLAIVKTNETDDFGRALWEWQRDGAPTSPPVRGTSASGFARSARVRFGGSADAVAALAAARKAGLR